MRISIIGAGYVGLVSGVCLAAKGHEVISVDSREEIIESINNGKAAIYEPYLSEYLEDAVQMGRLTATADLEKAVNNSEVSIVSVGTPYEGNGIDLSCIERVSIDIGRLLRKKDAYHVVCIKSTVIPGTTDTYVKKLLEEESGKKAGEFGLIMNPEFLREGEAVMDFMHPDRIVIGAYDDKSYEQFLRIYEGYFDSPILRVSLRTAEMIKYTSNSFLAMLISFSNEIAAISETVGDLDVEEVLHGVSLDKRLCMRVDGKLIKAGIINYLKAGRGFGGSCFPKDVKALSAFSVQRGYMPRLLKATIDINDEQVGRIVYKLEEKLGVLEGRRILILGLAFKQNSDDIRESPGIKLVKLLVEKSATVSVTDPMAMNNSRKELDGYENVCFLEDYKDISNSFDAAVLMTPWQEYLEILNGSDYEPLKNAVLYDGCRALQKNMFTGSGIKYIGVGLS